MLDHLTCSFLNRSLPKWKVCEEVKTSVINIHEIVEATVL